MNQLIRSYVEAHKKEYGLDDYDFDRQFEHFINKCVVNRLTLDRFDPQDVMTSKGEIGLDGIAIVLNGQLVTDIDICRAIYSQQPKVKSKFVFIQSKTSTTFDGGEINTFLKELSTFLKLLMYALLPMKKLKTLFQLKIIYMKKRLIKLTNHI